MAKKRTGDPWMAAPKYGASLTGLDINLLVADVSAAVSFATDVFGAETVYADRDFAVLKLGEMEWMVHADHTFDKHPLVGFVANVEGRGAGAEFCLHGIDPDKTEATRARRAIPFLRAPWTSRTACARPISSIRMATARSRTSR